MKFYERTHELDLLKQAQAAADQCSQMVVVTGRRGMGKTQLVLRATQGVPTLYFPVARMAEPMLCLDYVEEIRRVTGLPVHEDIRDMRSLFKFLIVRFESQRLNIILDEFQEFGAINPKVYADLQAIWDRNRQRCRLCLFLIGSNASGMEKLLRAPHAPLADRADVWLELTPLSTESLRNHLKAIRPEASPDDLLALYTFSGGVPKYVSAFAAAGALTRTELIRLLCDERAPFVTEGRGLLANDVGKEYTFYFSILACIAEGITTRSAIEDLLDKEIGGYLTRMESDFRLISKQTPLFSKSGSKNVRYFIQDNFLRFWFRYVYRNPRFSETGDFTALHQAASADYDAFSTLCLRDWFVRKLREQAAYDIVGGWWDHNDDRRIDIIAIQEAERRALIAGVAPKAEDVNLEALQQAALCLQDELAGYDITFTAFGIADM